MHAKSTRGTSQLSPYPHFVSIMHPSGDRCIYLGASGKRVQGDLKFKQRHHRGILAHIHLSLVLYCFFGVFWCHQTDSAYKIYKFIFQSSFDDLYGKVYFMTEENLIWTPFRMIQIIRSWICRHKCCPERCTTFKFVCRSLDLKGTDMVCLNLCFHRCDDDMGHQGVSRTILTKLIASTPSHQLNQHYAFSSQWWS